MALKAGRVGVRKDQVDNNGIINMSNVPTELPSYTSSDEGKMLTVDSSGELEFSNVPTEIPSHSSSDEGKALSVDSNGDLEFVTLSSGLKLYYKVFNGTTTIDFPDSTGSDYKIFRSNNVAISGYTPLFCVGFSVKDIYNVTGVCMFAKYSESTIICSGLYPKSTSGGATVTTDLKFKVYYVKNDEATFTELT